MQSEPPALATLGSPDPSVDTLMNLVATFSQLKAIVVGEAMLDSYLHGAPTRLCAEAPVPIVTLAGRQDLPGGAANTAVNLAALGAQVCFLSVIGADPEGRLLQQALAERQVAPHSLVIRDDRATLAKHRLLADAQMLVRFDQGTTAVLPPELETQLCDRLSREFQDCDAVIISDYGYGICTPRLIQTLAQLQTQCPRTLVIDAKNLRPYRPVAATAVKPNYSEALDLLGLTPPTSPTPRSQWLATQGEALLDLTGARLVALTLDTEGALLFQRHHPPYATAARPTSHTQAIGAGDTYISTLALALAAGADPIPAAELAAIAAAIVVAKAGTATCSAAELRQGLRPAPPPPTLTGPTRLLHPSPAGMHPTQCQPSWEEMLRDYQQQNYRIVFTNGCFDILHSGHIAHLQEARSLGDVLIVGINSDESIQKLKGPERPINPLADRVQVLAALKCVDLVIPFSDDRPLALIQRVRPQIYVKGGDYSREMLPEAPMVEALGGQVQILPYREQRSTTGLIQRIRQLARPIPPLDPGATP